ncbi:MULTISPECIES: hypothetical protein [Thermomonosporaceae]|uniref:hypothetical protein n=1 Tax=Thermomonosporaceae TaxID=2012 RepID=UPI00255AC0D2|nr:MULTISPECIES: hypothetical protein [Thermomonosporaceae]MDL4770792.1 hypothetical protein [Actinomadura xylanilytica]
MTTDGSAARIPHADVLREVARLGGMIDEDFEPDDRRVPTPLGDRPVPSPIQALLSVVWPEGRVRPPRRGARFVTYEDGDAYEVTFPQLVDGDPVAPDRACFIIAFNESTQYHWVIDLDDAHPDDPWVHQVDHDFHDAEFDGPERLSQMLAALQIP